MKSNFDEQNYFEQVNALIYLIVRDAKGNRKSNVKEDIRHLKLAINARDKMLVSWGNLNDKCKDFLNQIIR